MFSKAFRKSATAIVLAFAGAVAQAEPAIVDAAMSGDLKTVRALVRQAADVDAAQTDGMTALHWAVQRRDLEMMNVLLEAGAKHDLTNRTGAKPRVSRCHQWGRGGDRPAARRRRRRECRADG